MLKFLLISSMFFLTAGTLLAADVDPSSTQPAMPKIAPDVYRRTVFLGDSITDGNTYPQLVRTALEDAKLPPMLAINAGIGGDTAAGMLARLERDVLVHKPTLVTFNAAANDANRGVTTEAFERDVRAIVARLEKEKIPVILLTPNIVSGEIKKKIQPQLNEFEAAIRRIASDRHLSVAELNQRQNEEVAKGMVLLSPDDLHPNYEGQRMIARAVLDAMGYADLPVPARSRMSVFPGVIPNWKATKLPDNPKPLTEETVKAVKADDSWISLQLPEKEPFVEEDWLDDFRANGASVALKHQFPKGGKFLAVTTIDADQAKAMQFHTGAELQTVWINGKQAWNHDPASWHGYHIGRQSFEGKLDKGPNTIVIETGPVFFLSMTDGPMYPVK